MPIRLGGSNITKMYLGQDEILKIYKGTVQMYPNLTWNNVAGGVSFGTTPAYGSTVNVSIGSNVPAGALIRIIAHVYLGGGSWEYNVVVSQSSNGGAFTQYDYIDESMDVYVYGSISWHRLNATTVQFTYFTDYSNVQNAWAPFITGIDANY